MKEITLEEIDNELYLNSFVLLNVKKSTVQHRAAEHYDKYLREKLKELRNEIIQT